LSGNAILLKGVQQTANREIVIPGGGVPFLQAKIGLISHFMETFEPAQLA
jgi:hypothetical protein